jgi:outer membrane protein TolC
MNIKIAALSIFILLTITDCVYGQRKFTNFDSLMNYALDKSITLKSGSIKLSQAKKAKLAAIYNIADPTGGLSFSYTNNTKLPVNLFPGEIFGGQAGTFKEVRTGVQYVSYENLYAEVKLLNLHGWENFRLAKINIQLNESENKISLKTFYENMAVAYFNIVVLQEQEKATADNLKAADTLYKITVNKYKAGISKQQDVNDAKAAKINIEESINQIRFQTVQQYIALKLLANFSEDEDIVIEQQIVTEDIPGMITVKPNNIGLNNAILKERYAKSNYRQNNYSLMPTVSVFASQTTQQFNTRAKLFDNSVNWIPSTYIGLRLVFPIPSASAISQTAKAKYDYLLAKNSTAQVKIKTVLDAKALQVGYDKALSQATVNKEIFLLRKDSYEKNFLNYNEGLTGIDKIIDSLNAMVNSNYNLISSIVNILLAEAKININNKIN